MQKMLKATNKAISLGISNRGNNIGFEAYLDRDTLKTREIPLFVVWKAFAKDTSLKAELSFFEENGDSLRALETLLDRLKQKSVKLSLECTVDVQKLNYAEGQGKQETSISIILAHDAKVAEIVFGQQQVVAEHSLVTVDKQEFLTALRELL